MAPSFDCFSSLLCTEDMSVFDEIDDSMEISEEPWNPIDDQIHYQNQNQLIADPIEWLPPLLSDESLALLISKQCHHLPGIDYVPRLKKGDLDFAGRMEAIDWIEKVCSLMLFLIDLEIEFLMILNGSFGTRFDCFIPCLMMIDKSEVLGQNLFRLSFPYEVY